MKVFWIMAFVPAELAHLFHSETIASGGWVQGMRDRIAGQEGVSLTLVFKTGEKELKSGVYEEKDFRYIGIPGRQYCTSPAAGYTFRLVPIIIKISACCAS